MRASRDNYILNLRSIFLAVCFLLPASGGAQAQTPDVNKIWTTVGSDGTVDETDVSKVFFKGSVVQMGNPATTSTSARKRVSILQLRSAVIRYNITPVEGLFARSGGDAPGIQLKLRYLATAGAKVVAKLIEVDLATGTEFTRLTFDSGAFSTSTSYQVQAVAQCGPPPPRAFDFVNKAYYIEATLTGSAIVATTAAGIQIIKVANIPCFL